MGVRIKKAVSDKEQYHLAWDRLDSGVWTYSDGQTRLLNNFKLDELKDLKSEVNIYIDTLLYRFDQTYLEIYKQWAIKIEAEIIRRKAYEKESKPEPKSKIKGAGRGQYKTYEEFCKQYKETS